jgi:hypothetical protein
MYKKNLLLRNLLCEYPEFYAENNFYSLLYSNILWR